MKEHVEELKRVVWPDLYDYTTADHADGWDRLNALAEVDVYFDKPDLDTYLKRCEGAATIVSNWLELPKEVLDRLRGLELICVLGVGAVSRIDLQHAQKLGITVCNTPHFGDSTVAEHALGLMLSVCRGVVKADRRLREGKWELVEGKDLRGSTLGIVGIGSELAAKGNALGMNVLVHTNRPSPERAKEHGVRFVELDELLSTSDFVQLALALTDETEGLIGRRELQLMKPDAYLINVARAQIVDQTALLDALRNGRIAGYATDVFEEEPAYNHPLMELDNVVATPHVAWNTPGAAKRILDIVVDNVSSFLEGNPKNVVEI